MNYIPIHLFDVVLMNAVWRETDRIKEVTTDCRRRTIERLDPSQITPNRKCLFLDVKEPTVFHVLICKTTGNYNKLIVKLVHQS